MRRPQASHGERVDWGQLRALLAAGIRLDLRASRSAHGRTKLPPLVIALIVYSMMGTLLATALAGQRDPFVYALFTISAAMFMTGLVVIMEYGTAVVSPDDFQIIAHRPVSSKTYFWAKVGNLLDNPREVYIRPIFAGHARVEHATIK